MRACTHAFADGLTRACKHAPYDWAMGALNMKLVIRDAELEGDFSAIAYTSSNPGFGKHVEIRYGQRVCAATAKFVRSDKEMVYVDRWLRQFIDARNNDWVEVQRWEPIPAKTVSLAPLKRVRLDEAEISYFGVLLSNKP